MERILIIDDDPDVLTVLQMILRKKGYVTATAVQEQQIYEQIATDRPDLILMDVLLSGSDGRQICRRLKDSSNKDIPIIMLSGHPAAQKGMQDYGADDFLAKPFREKDVLQKIEKYLLPKTESEQ